MKEKIGGIVLCGGKSSRFGSDKGNYCFRQKPLIQYSIDVLNHFCEHITVVGPQYSINKNLDFVNDIYPESGPMGGIHAGLSKSPHDVNIVLACDLPFINHKLIQKLINETEIEKQITIFQTPDQVFHPLIGLYHKNLTDQLEHHLKQNKNKLIEFIKTQNHQIIQISDQDLLKSFININYLNQAQEYE